MTARPEHVAHYLQQIAAPATRAAYDHLQARIIANGHTMPPMRSLALTVDACGRTMQQINLVAITLTLGAQRAIALDGRPRGDSDGPRAKGGVSRPTESAADELARIKDMGLDLAEALDRIHPDPSWPTIASGLRSRLRTATETLSEACKDAWGTLSPAQALDDLADAVEGLLISVGDAALKARRAERCRAWGRDVDVDPPIEQIGKTILETVRCKGWPKGTHNGEPVGCGNFIGEFGHRHPETGSKQHGDLCDSCYALLCSVCFGAPRRTPGAKDCTTCSVRASRQRKAAA